MATQAERTAATTDLLLDATIAAIIAQGYRGASLPEICRRAGVSRGAQLHHFPTKESLVAAAVERLFKKRLSEMERRLTRAVGGVSDLRDAAALLWSVYTSDTFYAWLELVVAARTEPELKAIVSAIDARFVARAEKMCAAFFMGHLEDEKQVKSFTRLILSIFDGLAMHRILTGSDTEGKRALEIAAERGLFAPKGRDA
jgi:AcrR family transcriptional regulator